VNYPEENIQRKFLLPFHKYQYYQDDQINGDEMKVTRIS